MAFSESLAARVRDCLARTRGVEEKRLFGGVGFMLGGHLLVCVWKDSLIVRLGVDEAVAALRDPSVRPFDVTGTPMKGWVMVEPEGVDEDERLREWIRRAEAFVRTLPVKQRTSRA
jgi:hypothetical protein